MNTVAFYDTKPYDRDYFARAGRRAAALAVSRVSPQQRDRRQRGRRTAVGVFVNDRLDANCLEALHRSGVRHVALRCAGFNRVNLEVAKSLGLAVTRVPAY